MMFIKLIKKELYFLKTFHKFLQKLALYKSKISTDKGLGANGT